MPTTGRRSAPPPRGSTPAGDATATPIDEQAPPVREPTEWLADQPFELCACRGITLQAVEVQQPQGAEHLAHPREAAGQPADRPPDVALAAESLLDLGPEVRPALGPEPLPQAQHQGRPGAGVASCRVYLVSTIFTASAPAGVDSLQK